jgi:hypothetical protein
MKRALIALLFPALAAAEPSARPAADALFDEGKRLLAAGDAEHACAKLEASLQLVERLGVRLNLADCYEQQGRTATAWSEFRTAASQADKRGDARAGYARKRADALEPRLVKLELTVTAPTPGLEVRKDGAALPPVALGTAIPVDPGSYPLEASAAGYQTWSRTVEARTPGVIRVEIPQLVPAAPVAAIAPPRPRPHATPSAPAEAPDPARHRRRVIGVSVGIAGVAALGTGVALGLAAHRKWGSAGAHCTAGVCDPTGAAINRDARQLGDVGTVVGGVGVAALATGAILYLTAPRARPVVEHARLELGDRAAQLVLVTAF